MKNILFIVGSLRKNSFNMQLAKIVSEIVKDRAAVSFLEYADLPFMNQDIEFPAPEAVERVRNTVADADGIWIFTPEYNYQIPGVLKNLMDWLSRPLIKGDIGRKTVIKNKPVTVSGVAGRSAAAGARKNLSELVKSVSMKLICDTGTGISLGGESFSSDRLLVSDEKMDELNRQRNEFLESL